MKVDDMTRVLNVSTSKRGVRFRYVRVSGKVIYSIKSPIRRQVIPSNNELLTGSSEVHHI